MVSQNNTASIYIMKFYNDLEELNTYLGHYNNVVLDLRTKYGDTQTDKLAEAVDDHDKQQLNDVAREARFWCIKVFTKLAAIQHKFETQNTIFAENFNAIENNYKSITNSLVPRFDDLQEYVIELNKIFVSGIGMELLIKSQEYYEQLTSSNVYTGVETNGQEIQ